MGPVPVQLVVEVDGVVPVLAHAHAMSLGRGRAAPGLRLLSASPILLRFFLGRRPLGAFVGGCLGLHVLCWECVVWLLSVLGRVKRKKESWDVRFSKISFNLSCTTLIFRKHFVNAKFI